MPMKALTICQPYASLIVGWAGIDAADVKRVENRSWPTRYRGPLLIHAGCSTKWMKTWDGPTPGDDNQAMSFGYIVGSVEVVNCLTIEVVRKLAAKKLEMEWLKYYASGPWCWILRRPRRLITPIVYRGRQGLFNVPDDVLAGANWERQCRVCRCTELDACPGGCHWVEDDLCSSCEGE